MKLSLSSKLAGKAFAIGYGIQSAYVLLSTLMKAKNYKGYYYNILISMWNLLLLELLEPKQYSLAKVFVIRESVN